MGKPRPSSGDVPLKESLIQLVKDNPPIWDISSPGHHKANVLTNCWLSIEMEMTKSFGAKTMQEHDMNGIEKLKKMWQNLRTQFRSRKKLTAGKSGDGLHDIEQVKWQYYKQLQFLSVSVVAWPTQNSMTFVYGNDSLSGENED